MFIGLFTGGATAITGNYNPDSTPYVGIVVAFSDSARMHPISFSTGFLISSTVMVTAGHSLLGAAAVSVCFDKGPINFAINPDGTLSYDGDEPIYDGTPVAYPGYFPTLSGNQEFATSDIGLILLDTPVSDITEFPILPTAGFTETLPQKTALTVIGYGFQTQVTPKNNGVMDSWTGTLSCNNAQAQLIVSNSKGSDLYLKLTANSAQDKGGISFGDSGGPTIYTDSSGQDFVVAVNAFVSNTNCNGVTYHTRLDVATILGWLNNYLS